MVVCVVWLCECVSVCSCVSVCVCDVVVCVCGISCFSIAVIKYLD